MENAVQSYVKTKEKERFDKLTDEEQEDLGLLLLMQEADRAEFVSRDDVMKILES